MKITNAGFFIIDFRFNDSHHRDFAHKYHIVEFKEEDIGRHFDADAIMKSSYYTLGGPITWKDIPVACQYAARCSNNGRLPDELHNMAIMYFLETRNPIVKHYLDLQNEN